ncbi:bifunctional UDP-sugar hydrolase/5'-nucleotidase [Staphylococcus chromogenes]|nr:bifunctional UDP-sugar hydrolase/5'-nucleotidase [Staphylococcus chromogenes]
MSRRNFQRLTRTTTAAAAAVAMWATLTPAAFAQTAPVQFNIAGITDFHGHISNVVAKDGKIVEPGAAELACMLPVAAEGKKQLFVSSGDNIGGSAFNSALLNDEPTLQVLNQMGLKASAVGNHEFDNGYADLAGRVASLAEFPHLGANVEGENPDLKPYVIEEIDGVRVALVGTVTTTTADKVSPAGIAGITFTDPNKATNDIADKLKSEGQADVVVALIHEGMRTPEMFSNNVDIVMAGDSHLTDNQVITRKDGSKFALVQADHYSKALADLDITFDPATKKITDIKSTVHDAEAIHAACGATPDAAVAAIVAAAEEKAKQQGEQVVANTSHSFYRGSSDGTIATSGKNRGVESTLNNLLAEAAKQGIAGSTTVKPDLGVMNAGGVRADLEKGEVTYAEAFAVQPFGNEITYASVTGANIIQALEQQWKDPGADRPVLHLGWSDNLAYTFDPEAQRGKHITSVTIDGKPLDPAKTYTVAGSTFLLQGGDGFTAFGPDETKLPNTGIMDVQLFIDFLKANKDLAPRAGQSNVGVHFQTAPKPGKTVKVDLSSLIYTIDDPATTVAVEFDGQTVTAPITKNFEAATPGAGMATVELKMPEKGSDPIPMTIKTDAGTEITTLVNLEKPFFGSSDSSVGSTVGSLVGFVGVIALIVGGLQMLNPQIVKNFVAMLPVPLRDAVRNFLHI